MVIKEFLQNLKNKNKEKKELLKRALEQDRVQTLVEERKKNSNERELERFQEEARQEKIKTALQDFRNERRDDITFNHNPLDVPNITNNTDFEVLKQKNLFTGGSTVFNTKPLFFK